MKARIAGAVKRSVGARGRKRALRQRLLRDKGLLRHRGAMSYTDPLRVGGETSVDRALARAFLRPRFKMERFARALRAGGDFNRCWLIKGDHALPAALASLDAALARAVLIGQVAKRRARLASPGALREKESRARAGLNDLQSLWRLMKGSGADFSAVAADGAGFELYAWMAHRSFELCEKTARFWRELEKSPKREGQEIGVLEEVAIGRLGPDKERGLALLEALWPVECSKEKADEALGALVETSHEMANRRHHWLYQGVVEAGASRKIARLIVKAAEHIAWSRPEAMRAGNPASSALQEFGVSVSESVRLCEQWASARAEREELERGVETRGGSEGEAEGAAMGRPAKSGAL